MNRMVVTGIVVAVIFFGAVVSIVGILFPSFFSYISHLILGRYAPSSAQALMAYVFFLGLAVGVLLHAFVLGRLSWRS